MKKIVSTTSSARDTSVRLSQHHRDTPVRSSQYHRDIHVRSSQHHQEEQVKVLATLLNLLYLIENNKL